MLVKFYIVNNKEDLYLGDRYIFELHMDFIPRIGELVYTEEKMYRVLDVAHILTHSDNSNYSCADVDVTVIGAE